MVILFIIKTKWKEHRIQKIKWLANSEYHMIQQSVIRDEDNETIDEDHDSDGDISADENGVVAKSSNDDESDSCLLYTSPSPRDA